jgi:hypothetical protein
MLQMAHKKLFLHLVSNSPELSTAPARKVWGGMAHARVAIDLSLKDFVILPDCFPVSLFGFIDLP